MISKLLLNTDFLRHQVIILLDLSVEFFDDLVLPAVLFLFDLFHKLGVNSGALSVLLLDQLLDVGEASDRLHDEEVIHDVRVVSLQWNTIWPDHDWIDPINFLEFVIVIISVFILASCFVDVILVNPLFFVLNFL